MDFFKNSLDFCFTTSYQIVNILHLTGNLRSFLSRFLIHLFSQVLFVSNFDRIINQIN